MALPKHFAVVFLLVTSMTAASASERIALNDEIRNCMTVDADTEIAMRPPSSVNLQCFNKNEKKFAQYFYHAKDPYTFKIWAGYGLAALYDSRGQNEEAAKVQKRVQTFINVERLADEYSTKTGEHDQHYIRLYLLEQVRDEDVSAEIADAKRGLPQSEPPSNIAAILSGAAQGLNQGLAANPALTKGAYNPAPSTPQSQNYPQPSGSQSCTAVSQYVRVESQPLNGPAQCPHETAAWLTNNYGEIVTCEVAFDMNGHFGVGNSQIDVAPGQRVGGELSGIIQCGTSSATVKHICFAKSESDRLTCFAYGNINWNN